jgi:hypothetical protein
MNVSDELTQLIDSLADVLTEGERTEVREYVAAHEFGLALETTCGILLEERKNISREQYSRIRALSERLTSVDPKYVDAVEALVTSP